MNDKLESKLKQFFIREIADNTDILILQDEDGSYELFNRFKIHKINNGYKTISNYNSDEKLFSTLQNAVTWCIFENRNKFNQAKRVEYLDKMLAGTETNIEVHKKLIRKTKDLENKLIYISKMSQEQAKRKLMLREMSNFIAESKMWQTKKFATK